MDALPSERARAVRLLVAVTFHFAAERLIHLAEVLRSLSEYPVAAMEIVVVTNTLCQDHLALLRRLCREVMSGKSASVRSYGDLSHPFDLAWCYKAIISKEFVGSNHGRYTHFIYLENDIRLSFLNFCYFVEYCEILRHFGLLPAFVRVEYSAALGGFVASDAFWPIYVPAQSHIRLGDSVLVNMPKPFNPCFILDVELAAEYVRSRSFDHDQSLAVGQWGARERAARGLCLENVPPPFQSRYLVPVSRHTGRVPAFAWISHLPNTYADNPFTPLGKVRMDELFAGVDGLAIYTRNGMARCRAQLRFRERSMR